MAGLILGATPKRRPRHQGPAPSDRKEGSSSKKPRHDFGTGPRVLRAGTREIKKVHGYPEKSEQRYARSRKGEVGCYREDAFANHFATLTYASSKVMRQFGCFGEAASSYQKAPIGDVPSRPLAVIRDQA